jgi:tetratricopeptide (TPR) repeat protein
MRGALLVLVVALVTLSSAAAASPAEDLYVEGKIAYDRGDYQAAIEQWQKSYQLSSEGDLLYNIAHAMRLSGNCKGAIGAYKRFLAGDATAEQRKIAEDFVRELGPTCRADPEPDPAGGLKLVAALTAPKDPRPGRKLRVTGLATGGIGVVLTVTGLTLGRYANTLGSEVAAACASDCDWGVQKEKDARGRRYAKASYVLDGLGVATIAGGAVMYYLGSRGAPVIVAPRGEGGAVISWSGSW